MPNGTRKSRAKTEQLSWNCETDETNGQVERSGQSMNRNMTSQIDVGADFRGDASVGIDPDSYSPVLRENHRILWNKRLPSGHHFTLTVSEDIYLLHESSLGRFARSSDAIATRLKGRAAKIAKKIPPESVQPDLGYTISRAIIFPSNRVDRASANNGARGIHPRIADRFDLTLECIRRLYRDEASPLSATLERYADYFALF